MKAIYWIIAALGLTLVLPAAADAGQNDPEVIIYRFPGVRDDGGDDSVGVATIFSCTNFSGAQEQVRLVTRNGSNFLVSNLAVLVPHLATVTFGTHHTSAYPGYTLNTNFVVGTTAIAATSTNVICTAMTIDAANPKPDGVALRGIRFNPVPGSQ